MSLTAYEISIPILVRGLSNLQTYLDHAETLGAERPGGVEGVLAARLAPDMLTLAEQIRVVANKAVRHAARLADAKIPPFVETEATVEALRAQLIEATLYLNDLPEAAVTGAETRTFELSTPIVRGWFAGNDYILDLVLPDFFFHLTTVHDILRHLGAPIGKKTYLGQLGLQSGGYT
jgi:hypothetical protein